MREVSGPVLPTNHRAAMVIVPIAIVPVLAVGLVLAWGAPMPFDADRWNGEGTGRRSHERFSWGDNTRARMLDDLLTTHLHAGMRPAETEALLGQYDHSTWQSFEILPRPALSQMWLACGPWWWPIPNLQLEFTDHRNRPDRLIEARVIKYFD